MGGSKDLKYVRTYVLLKACGQSSPETSFKLHVIDLVIATRYSIITTIADKIESLHYIQATQINLILNLYLRNRNHDYSHFIDGEN